MTLEMDLWPMHALCLHTWGEGRVQPMLSLYESIIGVIMSPSAIGNQGSPDGGTCLGPTEGSGVG